MAESIEAFIRKLQKEGVEAAREAGQQIVADAEKQAEVLLQEANRQAKAIIDAAYAESEKVRQRTETELKLAARDAVGRLQETLSHILQALLRPPIEQKLRDPDFLAQLIRDVVIRYVEADLADGAPIAINVSEELRPRLTQWALEAFPKASETGTPVALRTLLAQAGFEYRIGDGTVEVTADSLVELFLEMVGPELRKFVAAGEEQTSTR